MIRGVLKSSGLMMLAEGTYTLVSGFLLVPLFTRNMSTDAYGVVVVVRSIGAVMLPLLFFSGSAYMRHYYRYEGEQRRRFAGTVLTMTLGSIVLAWLMTVLLAPWVQPRWLPKLPVLALYWAVVLTTLDVLKSFADISLRLAGRFLLLALASLGQLAAYTALALWLVRQDGLGFGGWALSTSVSTLGVGVVLWWNVRRQFHFGWMKDAGKTVLVFSWPLVLSQLAWFVMNRSDVLLLQRYRTLTETAVYGVTYSMGLLLLGLAGPLDKVMTPLFYRDIDTDYGREQWTRLTTIILCGTAVVATLLCAIAPVLYRAMFPESYSWGVGFLPFIVWAFVCRVFDVFFSRALLYRDRTLLVMLIQVSSAILNLGLNVLLIPRYGAPAAAISTLAAFTLNSALLLGFGSQIMPLPYEYSRLALVIGAGVAASVLWSSLGIAWSTPGEVALSLALLVVYALLAVQVGCIPLWRELRNATARLGKRLSADA